MTAIVVLLAAYLIGGAVAVAWLVGIFLSIALLLAIFGD
jgi:hypothetical protein